MRPVLNLHVCVSIVIFHSTYSTLHIEALFRPSPLSSSTNTSHWTRESVGITRLPAHSCSYRTASASASLVPLYMWTVHCIYYLRLPSFILYTGIFRDRDIRYMESIAYLTWVLYVLMSCPFFRSLRIHALLFHIGTPRPSLSATVLPHPYSSSVGSDWGPARPWASPGCSRGHSLWIASPSWFIPGSCARTSPFPSHA